MEDPQQQQREQQFTKGFNSGYLLSEHEPELFKKIIASPAKDNAYFDGLKAGDKQRQRDAFKDKMRKAQEKGKERERD